ncbi:MAG: hypothetical protein K8S62_02090 [Candidatus Sabulitectum sp.]|nr:hypothetical protein [Candidatus Sabulitectum sp.]
MKKINRTIIAAVAASLILVAGCYDADEVTLPPVDGYDGLVAKGWSAFEDANYKDAMEYFQQAIDMNVARPDAYVGAGWTAIVVPDYWVIGDQYDYMAVQLDGGTWPVETYSAVVPQNLNWSEFECIYPVLTANDLTVINAFGTTDTLIIDDSLVVFEPDSLKPAMDNQEIGQWLYDQYGAIRFQYTFEIGNPDINAIFEVENGFSHIYSGVDSIVNGASASTVYISVPYDDTKVGAERYKTWCMYENEMIFEYATYQSAVGQTAFATDAVAAFGILQNARGENGDVHFGVAALLGLADEGEYSFSHHAGTTTLKLRGMAAAMAFSNTYFRPALDICQDAGYALDIEVTDPNFLPELMQVIELMLQ